MFQRTGDVNFLEGQRSPNACATRLFDVHKNDIFAAFEVKTVWGKRTAELRVLHNRSGYMG